MAETTESTESASLGQRLNDYWFEPVPQKRLAIFSAVIHLMVLYTVFRTDDWAASHGWAPRSFYRPVFIARVFDIPAPTETTILILQIVIGICAVGSISQLGPKRVFNVGVFLGYFLWLVWAFSFSKVDHDRLTIFVALLVISLVPTKGMDPNPIAGWALRTVQWAFVLAYPLSAVSKLKKSGLDWANSAVFARAIVRRGTELGDWFVQYPQLLRIGQWTFIAFELLAILALSPNRRVRNIFLAGIIGLHVFTYATITIHFLPHTICILAFFSLEKFPEWIGSKFRGDTLDSGLADGTSGS